MFSNFSLFYREPKAGFKNAFAHININFLLFISGYPTLSRLTNCLLNRWFQRSTRFNQTLAAFFGGIPFYFCSNELSWLSHTAATAVELLWQRYEHFGDSSAKSHKFLMQVPFAELIYIFGGAYMYHTRVFYPWLAPKFLVRLVDLLTNHK